MGQRFLLIIALNATLVSAAYAQQGFEIGTTTTFNGSFIIHGQNLYQTLNNTPIYQVSRLAYRFTFGYNVGLAGGYNFNEKYGIVASVSYNKAGEHYDDVFHPGGDYGPGPLSVTRRVDLGYVQVPIMFKYDFVTFKKRYRLYAMSGPEFSFLVNSDEKIWINHMLKTGLNPASAEYKKFDFGWALGTGADIYIRQDLYFEGGLFGYVGFLDMNTGVVKYEPWYAENNVKYQKSYNFHPGIEVGIHFLFNKDAHNGFAKESRKAEPVLPTQGE